MPSKNPLGATTVALLLAILPGPALAGPSKAPPAKGAVLTVKVHGLRHDRGRVMLAVFNGKSGFPKMKNAVRRATTAIKGGKAKAILRGLPPGTYAVSVCHDENGNGKLDTSWIGRPKEGVGMSNDARGHRGPPKYKDASFKIGTAPREIRIKVRY
jgi:uncharacterized protein (DUF2141 family)